MTALTHEARQRLRKLAEQPDVFKFMDGPVRGFSGAKGPCECHHEGCGYCQILAGLDVLLAALDRRAEGETWQPMETAPRDREVFFWIVPKTAEETYTDTAGRPILSGADPYRLLAKFGQWPSLSKAIYWHDVPAPPSGGQT